MRVAISYPDRATAERWCVALQSRLPGMTVAADPDFTDADVAFVWYPPPGFFARHPRLRAAIVAGAGVDALFMDPELPPALPVVRLEDAGMGRQMAEYCCHEVFRLYRGYDRYEQQQHRGEWFEIEPPPPAEFPVGVFGMGVLGSHVAQTLAGFGYRVLGYSRTAPPPAADDRRAAADAAPIERFSGPHGLAPFLAACRVVILLAPLTRDTQDIVDARWLAQMRSGAWLINVARGALVVEADLLAALDAGHLAGATLDVFRQEPLPASHPFRAHPKIRVTPHIAAITLVDEGASQVADKIGRLAAGLPVSGIVDRLRGY